MIQKTRVKKIVITGGHFTPALAVVRELEKDNWKIHWIGSREAIRGHDVKSLEAKILPGMGVPFWEITAIKFDRRSKVYSLLFSWRFLVGFVKSLFLLISLRPSVVLSFGSYVSVPVALASWFLGIPVVIHEQTSVSGLANRLVARIAKFVAVSYPESVVYFPQAKTVVTGNPIRGEILDIWRQRSKKPTGRPLVLYITGGSRGSQIINKAVLEILPALVKSFKVYHQVGDLDFKKMTRAKGRLTQSFLDRYEVVSTYSPERVEKIYKKADIVVSRGGGNTIAEIAAIGVPAIIIPIPWVDSNEQVKNARMLASFGGSVVLPQDDLTGKVLLEKLNDIIRDFEVYKRKARRAKRIIRYDAGHRILDLIDKAKRG